MFTTIVRMLSDEEGNKSYSIMNDTSANRQTAVQTSR